MCLCGPCLPALGAAQSCARRDSLGFSVSKIGRFLGLPTRGAASPPCSFGWGRMPGKTINRDLTRATRSMNTRSLMAKLSQPQLLTTVSVALLAGEVSPKVSGCGHPSFAQLVTQRSLSISQTEQSSGHSTHGQQSRQIQGFSKSRARQTVGQPRLHFLRAT